MDKPVENAPQPPYEDKPVAIGVIVKAALALVIIGAAIHAVMWWQFKLMDNMMKKADPHVSPLQPKKYIPPAPHLEAETPAVPSQAQEPFDPGNLAVLRSQESTTLDSYSWVDEKNGIVRIPVQVAMKKIIEQSSQQQQSQTQPQPQTTPNEQ